MHIFIWKIKNIVSIGVLILSLLTIEIASFNWLKLGYLFVAGIKKKAELLLEYKN